MIISRTPFRISLFGGGTDYPAWYRTHGGAVLAAAIDKYCYLSCRYLPPFFEHRFRIVYSKIENCETVDQIEHPAVRAVLTRLDVKRGIEIHHDGDLPARSGMGSSSAFTVGLLHAVHVLQGTVPTQRRLVTGSIVIEQDVLKEIVGSQDQVTAAFGGFNHIAFVPDGEIVVTPIAAPRDRTDELNRHLMLFYTGITRTASQVAETYVHDIERNEPALRRTAAFVDEGRAILNGREPLTRIGLLLHEAWRVKCTFSPAVTNPAISALYDEARAAGAMSGKLTGAGGGGFMLLFVEPHQQARVRQALRRLIHVPFSFDFSGSRIVFHDSEKDYLVEERARAGMHAPLFSELDPRRHLLKHL